MRFSIIIPTLNEEKYLGKLLDSLVVQDHKDFEVLVVDGDSKDRTEQVALFYNDKLSLSFVKAPHRGVGFQRNYGAAKAMNEDLVFFDADVIIKPDFLRKINDYLVENPSDMLTTWAMPISKRAEDLAALYVFNVAYLELRKHFDPQASGAFIYVKKAILETVGGFPEDVIMGEDMGFASNINKLGYSFSLLRDPKVYFSVRRLDKEGRLRYAYKVIRASVHRIVKGPLKDPRKYKYEMGNYD